MDRTWLVSSIVAALLFSACADSTEPTGGARRPLVMAAVYPLQFVAEEIGGSAIEVHSLTPSGVEPHDLELSSGQIRELVEADLIVYLGQGFQPAVEDVLSGLDPSKRFDALEGRDLLQSESEEEEVAVDPHVWLDPMLLDALAGQMADRLAEIDPDHAQMFADNASRLHSELQRLDEEFSNGLEDCASREMVTSHAAFGYLAARYDLEQVSISGIDPEGEPSPRRLAEIAKFVDEHDVSTIFFEELAPPDLAETLARETGARTDVLSTLETPPERGDYLNEMRSNLARLQAALDCG